MHHVKTWLVIIICCLLLIAVAGCDEGSGSGGSSQSGTNSGENTQPPTPPSDDQTTPPTNDSGLTDGLGLGDPDDDDSDLPDDLVIGDLPPTGEGGPVATFPPESDGPVAHTPEPATSVLFLVGAGVAAVAGVRRRRNRARRNA